MTTTIVIRRNPRPLRHEAATHLYAVGQAVRFKGNFGTFPKTAEIYHITGMLPPRDNSPQYRIRHDEERHERVTTQDSLDPVHPSPDSENANLLEKTFGYYQGTKKQQSRDSKALTTKGAGKS